MMAHGIAAQMLGLAEEHGNMRHGISKERKQFGKPIAEFQLCSFCWPSLLPEIEAGG